jgi:hypothetical protein
MKYMVRKSVVRVIGRIWMPAAMCAMEYDVRPDDLRDEEGKVTRESIEDWTTTHTGDFQSIEDFEADVEDGEETRDFPWSKEESELTFHDCMYPAED